MRKKPGQRSREFPLRGCVLLENTHLRVSVEHLQLVRGCLDIGGEIFARTVAFHVKATLPQFAGCHIDDLAAVGNIHGLSVLAVELSKFFRAELFNG